MSHYPVLRLQIEVNAGQFMRRELGKIDGNIRAKLQRDSLAINIHVQSIALIYAKNRFRLRSVTQVLGYLHVAQLQVSLLRSTVQ